MLMRNFFLRVCRSVLALLGVSAAGCDLIGVGRVEYGCPYADFEVKGKVTDALRDLPLQGIRVSATDEFGQNKYAAVTTDSEGRFELLWSDFPDETVTLLVEDVDGPDNGGTFAPQTFSVQLEQTEAGDGDWYEGRYSATDVTVRMNEDTSGSGW